MAKSKPAAAPVAPADVVISDDAFAGDLAAPVGAPIEQTEPAAPAVAHFTSSASAVVLGVEQGMAVPRVCFFRDGVFSTSEPDVIVALSTCSDVHRVG